MEVLTERELPGWPGVTVRIEWDRKSDNCTVIVTDPAGDTVIHEGKFIEADNGRERAKDAYFHPFVYGYQGANLAGVS